MALEINGFLSDQAPNIPMSSAPELERYNTFANDVNRFALDVVRKPRTISHSPDLLLPLGLLGRLVQDYEASVLLANRGFRAQSRSMARSTLETAFFCVAACRDSVQMKNGKKGTVSFLDAFIAEHEKFRTKVAKELADMPVTATDSKVRLDALHKHLTELGHGAGVDVKGLSENLGFAELYTVLYRPLSQDSHPTATSVEHHIVSNNLGGISGFRVGPDYSQYRDTVLAAAVAILLGMDAYTKKFGDDEEILKCSDLALVYKALSETLER